MSLRFWNPNKEWQTELFSPHFSQPWYNWLHLGHKLGFGLIKLITNKNVKKKKKKENQLLHKFLLRRLFVNGFDYMTIRSFSAFSFTASKRQKYVLLTVKQTPHESCWDAGDSVVHSILGFYQRLFLFPLWRNVLLIVQPEELFLFWMDKWILFCLWKHWKASTSLLIVSSPPLAYRYEQQSSEIELT